MLRDHSVSGESVGKEGCLPPSLGSELSSPSPLRGRREPQLSFDLHMYVVAHTGPLPHHKQNERVNKTCKSFRGWMSGLVPGKAAIHLHGRGNSRF